VFSWIIAPWFFGLLLTNDLVAVLGEAFQQHLAAVGWTYLFGTLWGLGGLTFGLTMRYLGMSLGMGVALGYCAAFGTLQHHDPDPGPRDEAMDDDIAVPQALAVIHEVVRSGNSAIAAGDMGAALTAADAVVAMLDVLGLNPYAAPWAGASASGRETEVIDSLVRVVLDQRQEARARKDFATADALRDGLDRIGIRIEDTASGVRWSLED
jgi:hypothetical protein